MHIIAYWWLRAASAAMLLVPMICVRAMLLDLGSGDNVSVIVVQLASATAATLQVPQQPLLQQQQQQQQQQSASAAAAAASNEHTAQQQQPMSYPDMLPPSMKSRA
eukprot:18206-Heterococcus_DN1.PRE.1